MKKNDSNNRAPFNLISETDADIIGSAAALRHLLHENAEPSGFETETMRILKTYLEENTSLELHDQGAWFYAVYRASNDRSGTISDNKFDGKQGKKTYKKRRIAFRADMDALPVSESIALPYASKNKDCSHKCGHDGHSASLAAFARFIDRHGSNNDIYFLFQPSEENGTGALLCRELIEKEKIDELYGYHNMPGFPLGSVAVHKGVAACASKGLELIFEGKNSHASQPEAGRNPAFVLSKTITAIPAIVRAAAADDPFRFKPPVSSVAADDASMTSFGADGIVMCTITAASVGSRQDGSFVENFGTSAGYARLLLTLRAGSESRLELVERMLVSKANSKAKTAGLKLKVEEREPFPATVNDDESAERVLAAAKKLDLTIADWDEPFRSSEDFGYYTRLTKGALFFIGCGEDHAPLHTSDYDFSDELIEIAVALFSELASI